MSASSSNYVISRNQGYPVDEHFAGLMEVSNEIAQVGSMEESDERRSLAKKVKNALVTTTGLIQKQVHRSEQYQKIRQRLIFLSPERLFQLDQIPGTTTTEQFTRDLGGHLSDGSINGGLVVKGLANEIRVMQHLWRCTQGMIVILNTTNSNPKIEPLRDLYLALQSRGMMIRNHLENVVNANSHIVERLAATYHTFDKEAENSMPVILEYFGER